MAQDSRISWTQHTWNPIAGCSKVSQGCKHCYAERAAASARLQQFPKYQAVIKEHGQWNGHIYFDEKALQEPLKRKKPTTYFVNSMSDMFHMNVREEWIDSIFAVMALCPRHTFQVLTKRPVRMSKQVSRVAEAITHSEWAGFSLVPWPLPNVWLGTSVENREAAYDRIPFLLATPAAVRFLSCEPLLEAINIGDYLHGIHWVICGGESGPGHRPMKLEWAQSLREQCLQAGVPFFFKQTSGPRSGMGADALGEIIQEMPNHAR